MADNINTNENGPDQAPPAKAAVQPSFVEAMKHYEDFRTAILKTIEDIIRPYKVIAICLASALVAVLGFFGFKAWPDFENSIHEEITSKVTSQLDADFKTVHEEIKSEASKEINEVQKCFGSA
jgi:hypothetical protein